MTTNGEGFDCDLCGNFIPLTPDSEGATVMLGEYYTPAETLADNTLPDIVCRACALKQWPNIVGTHEEFQERVNQSLNNALANSYDMRFRSPIYVAEDLVQYDIGFEGLPPAMLVAFIEVWQGVER